MRNNTDCRGFTYLAALMVVMVMGIMLGIAGQSWKTVMQREQEEELIFRGLQYRKAFFAWYSTANGQRGVGPRDLKDLLEDPNSLTKKRYIRRIYNDPMTGKDFDLVKDSQGKINGVVSTSTKEAFKTHNFPAEINELEGRAKYNEWVFGYKATLPTPVQIQ